MPRAYFPRTNNNLCVQESMHVHCYPCVRIDARAHKYMHACVCVYTRMCACHVDTSSPVPSSCLPTTTQHRHRSLPLCASQSPNFPPKSVMKRFKRQTRFSSGVLNPESDGPGHVVDAEYQWPSGRDSADALCLRACVRACMRACVRACVRACTHVLLSSG
jgi:hypothetical protein